MLSCKLGLVNFVICVGVRGGVATVVVCLGVLGIAKALQCCCNCSHERQNALEFIQ